VLTVTYFLFFFLFFFLGGVPDLERHTAGRASSNYDGCIIDIQIQGEAAINIGTDAIGGANVRPCLN
jgi:hypothetical protein